MLTFKNIIHVTIISNIFGIINCHLGLNEGSRCNTDNLIGLCTKLSECQSMTNLLQTGKMRFRDIITCSYVRDTPIVCCLDNPQLIETSTHKQHTRNPGGLIFPGPTSESRFVSGYRNTSNSTPEIQTTSKRPIIPERTTITQVLDSNVKNLTITDQKEFIDLTELLKNWQNTNNTSLSKNNSITIIPLPLLNNINLNNRDVNISQGIDNEKTNINLEKIPSNSKIENQNLTDYFDIFDTTKEFINVRQTKSLNSTHLDLSKNSNSINDSVMETEQTRGSWSLGSTKEDSVVEPKTKLVPTNIKSKLTITDSKTSNVGNIESSIMDWTNSHNRDGGIRSSMVIVPVDSNFQVGNIHGNVHHNDQGMWNGRSWGGRQRSMQVAPNHGGNVGPTWRGNQGNPSWGLNSVNPTLENNHIDPYWRVEPVSPGWGNNHVDTSWGRNNIHSSRGHHSWNPTFDQVQILEGNQIDTMNNNLGNQEWSGNSNSESANSNRWPPVDSNNRAEKLQINPENPWLSKNHLTRTTTSTTRTPDILFPNDERLTSIRTKSTPKPTLDPWIQDALSSKLPTAPTTELDPWIKDALNHGRNDIISKPQTPSNLDPWIKEALDHQLTTTTSSSVINDPWAPYEPKFPTTTIKSDTQPSLEPWIKEALDLSNPPTTVKPNIEHIDLNRLIKGLPNAGSPFQISSENSSRTTNVKNPSNYPISDVNILNGASGGRAARSEREYITFPASSTEKPKEKIVDKSNANNNLRKSDKACQLYRSLRVGKIFFHITDGLPVDEGEFPHMVALGYPSTGFGSEFTWDCGGSLISERYVLTAAHCAGRIDPTKVRIGKLSLDTNLDNLTAVDVSIENIILHPEYSSFLKYNDIALIRLANDVEFVPGRILPACLNTKLSDVDSNTTLWATGWGVVSTNTRSRSPVLLKAPLTSYGLMTCNETHINYGVTRQYPTGLDNGQLCAGDPQGKKDTCQGDSGGPLQYLEINKDMPVVIGVTSFGASCGTTIPSVYARVAYYLEWIESIVWP